MSVHMKSGLIRGSGFIRGGLLYCYLAYRIVLLFNLENIYQSICVRYIDI